MLIRPTRLTFQLAAAFGSALLLQGAAMAQASLERVEITGSSIKRIAAEGALPVITLTKKDIEQSGATSVRDLVQALPSMQGFTSASDSINGGGGGTTTASLRNLGSIYTLVLLNGRRVAPFNTGSTVNLEQLPLSMIERVEVLADGASTLYGSDAIAGVVNFITKKNTTSGGIDISVSKPQGKGGQETMASISKGIGDLESDGFNLLAGLTVEKQGKIMARDRSFSKSGIIPFKSGGRDLYMFQSSGNSNPPNITMVLNRLDPDGDPVAVGFNPILLTDGNCGSDPASFQLGAACRYDFGSVVEAQPMAERKNLFLSGRVKATKDLTAFGEALISDTNMSAHYAPPAQGLAMAKGSTLYNRYITPNLAALNVLESEVETVSYNMRLSDAGGRGDNYKTKANHLVAGLEGSLAGFDGSVSYTKSWNTQQDEMDGGFTSRNAFDALIDQNLFDPFAQGTPASQAAIAPAVLKGLASETKSKLDTLSLRASGPAFEMGSGSPAMLGVGADFSKQSYSNFPAPIFQGDGNGDFPIGSAPGQQPFDTSRKNRGVYGELLFPFSKAFELTAALRYDSYDSAFNSYKLDAAGNRLDSEKQGNSASKSTYKIGMRFQPSADVLIRGSFGTGFRVPTLKDITETLADFGVTDRHACPVPVGDALRVGCRPLVDQFNKLKGGNPFTGDAGLKPENSTQWTLGMRLEPSRDVTVGTEIWNVKVKDVITVVPEQTAFDNFQTYRSLFTLTKDAGTGLDTLTFNEVPINGAVAASTGIDFDLTLRSQTPIGRLTSQAMATYLFSSYYDYGFGGGKESSIGKLGSDDQVAFRTLLTLRATLETGAFSNTLSMYWKPGYVDQGYTADDAIIFIRNPDGTRGARTSIDDFKVPAYYTFDWQGKWSVNKDFSVIAGVKNLLDKDPPLSIKTVGGNMVGVDPRYHDIKGRTLSLSASYKF